MTNMQLKTPKRIGIILGLAAILATQLACGLSGGYSTPTPEPTKAPVGSALVAFSTATGMGCQRLYKHTGASGAGIPYDTFIEQLENMNNGSYALDFYGQEGDKDCNMTASPYWPDVADKYKVRVELYPDNDISSLVDQGLAQMKDVYGGQ